MAERAASMAANGHRRRIEKLEGRLAPFNGQEEPEEVRKARVAAGLQHLMDRRKPRLEDLSPYDPDKCGREGHRRAQQELKAFIEWRVRRGRGNYG
jgi:hypothetical protein